MIRVRVHSVLGAGVAGLCLATELSERGLAVEVIAPDPVAAGGPTSASWLAGGMLAPFCEGESAPETVVSRGQGAAAWWAKRVKSYVQRGTLVLAAGRDGAELDRFARATRGHVWHDPAALEPDLAGRFSRGLFYASEAHMDPREALTSLRSALIARGVSFRSGPPSGPPSGAMSGGRILDCRGMASTDRLPSLRAVRGEMVIVQAPDVMLTRTIRLLHPRFACYIVPRGQGRYLIGATMVESADARGITARATMELLSAAYTVHPAFAEAEILETGAGLRPSFPDNLPAIVDDGDRIHLNGCYRHGFLLAPVLAAELAARLAAQHTAISQTGAPHPDAPKSEQTHAH